MEPHGPHLGLDLVVEELLVEPGERVVGAVIVQVQGVEHVPAEDTAVTSSLPPPQKLHSAFHLSRKEKQF